ncbi:MAG TPA: hypothetical protein VMV18_11460 [bacterium]|nr:hypothetical protein [bacterium]
MARAFASDVYQVTTGGPQLMAGTPAPNAGAGVAAPLDSLYMQTGTTNWWKKTAAGDTAWTLVTITTVVITQTFVYTATGAEGSDFNVALPTAEADDAYEVQGALIDPSNILAFSFPNALAGDRTTTQFRVITTSALVANDTLQFWITR